MTIEGWECCSVGISFTYGRCFFMAQSNLWHILTCGTFLFVAHSCTCGTFPLVAHSYMWYSLHSYLCHILIFVARSHLWHNRTFGTFLLIVMVAHAYTSGTFLLVDVVVQLYWWHNLTSGKFMMKLWAFASLAAWIISSIVTSALPYFIFSAIVVANNFGSWLTMPMCWRNHLTFQSRRSIPSINTWNEQQGLHLFYLFVFY